MKHFWILALIYTSSLYSQQFSVLTCDRGKEIYSTFGHSAFRYVDSAKGIDWVYNYGLFDFGDPNFIPKFCMGKLDYKVGKEDFHSFVYQYQYQNRTVREQKLVLTDGQRDSLLSYLEWNILPENQYYRYDFLYNNCATKIIDVLKTACPALQMKYYVAENPKSFRQLIHQYASNTVPYIDWGMDMALGMSTDKKATPKEYTFLPDYVFKAIELSWNPAKNERLGSLETTLIQGMPNKENIPFYKKPVFLAFLILLLGIVVKFSNVKWQRNTIGVIFIILGIGGLVIAFEWFCTEHTVTKNNWNLGWLNPFALIYGIGILSNRSWRWVRNLVNIGGLASLLAWLIGWQEFETASKLMILFVLVQSVMVMYRVGSVRRVE